MARSLHRTGSTRHTRFLIGTAGAVVGSMALLAGPAGAALPAAPSTERTSANAGTGSIELPAVTADGTREVFVGRGTGNAGVWLKDRVSGLAYHLTTGMDFNPDISTDGTTVAFVRYGSERTVYVMDVTNPSSPGSAVLASRSGSGQAANGLSDFPSLNADGTVIAFQSTATNLDPSTPPPASGGPTKVYVRDLVGNTTEMVSVDNSGAAQPGNAIKPDLDASGRYVAFAGEADLSGPVATPTAGSGEEETTTTFQQIWVRDRTADSTTAASVSSTGVVGDAAAGLLYGPTISADGNVVAFESDATNLVPADTNARTDAFAHDMTTLATTRVSERTPTTEVGAFHAVAPVRLLDTRLPSPVMVGPGETVEVPVAGVSGVPVDAAAVALNVTATEPTAWSFLTAYPSGTILPEASTVNFTAGQTIANAATVKIGTNGAISITNAFGDTHVVVDLAGWYDDAQLSAGGGLITTQPTRLLDTRLPSPVKVGPGETVSVAVTGVSGVPADAAAVALSVTATEPTDWSFLTVNPGGAAVPTASNLNFVAGQTIANSVLVAPGVDGTVDITNAFGDTHIVVDLNGWVDATLPNGGFTALAPYRALDTRVDPGTPVGPASTTDLTVLGQGGVPTMGVTSVALNVTVTEPTAWSFLTVFPTGTVLPTASNLNFTAGQTVAVQVLAQVGADGKVSIANAAGYAHIVVDIAGWYSGVQVSEGGQGAAVSGDGQHVAFESLGSTMTAGDVNGVMDAFVRDLGTPLTERVSVVDENAVGATEATGTRTDGHTGETVAQKNGTDVAINSDGSMVAFSSHGNLAGDRTIGEETPGEISTESAVFTRTRS